MTSFVIGPEMSGAVVRCRIINLTASRVEVCFQTEGKSSLPSLSIVILPENDSASSAEVPALYDEYSNWEDKKSEIRKLIRSGDILEAITQLEMYIASSSSFCSQFQDRVILLCGRYHLYYNAYLNKEIEFGSYQKELHGMCSVVLSLIKEIDKRASRPRN